MSVVFVCLCACVFTGKGTWSADSRTVVIHRQGSHRCYKIAAVNRCVPQKQTCDEFVSLVCAKGAHLEAHSEVLPLTVQRSEILQRRRSVMWARILH